MRIPTLTMFLLNNDVTKHNSEELFKQYIELYGKDGNLRAMRRISLASCDKCREDTLKDSWLPSLEDKLNKMSIEDRIKVETRANELMQQHRFPGSVGYE